MQLAPVEDLGYWTGVTGACCEPPGGCKNSNLHLLEEQPVFLTTKPPSSLTFFCMCGQVVGKIKCYYVALAGLELAL